MTHGEPEDAFWSGTAEQALDGLGASAAGLTAIEASARLRRWGPNAVRPHARRGDLLLLLSQFRSPLVLLLLLAAALALVVRSQDEALIILVILLLTGLLGFLHERSAGQAVARLLALVAVRATVLRDGTAGEIPVEELVPGDVVLLAAGSLVPADGLVLEARDLLVDEATLTGETFPVEKRRGLSATDAPPAGRVNALFLGTHVSSGTGRMLVVGTGERTRFGRIAQRLRRPMPQGDFERGVQRFGYMLMRTTAALVLAVFAVNVLLDRPALESFLFSLALAVGITPELLPAIVSTTLARGARRMAAGRVIVKRLASIENLGTMDLLCADKTGTLTEGRIALEQAIDVAGGASEEVLDLAVANALFQAGLPSPIDEALRRSARPAPLAGLRRLDEVPFDFVRKRLSVLVERAGTPLLVTKGALLEVLSACSRARLPDGREVALEQVRAAVEGRAAALSEQGLRTLGLAVRALPGRDSAGREDERELTLLGLLAFSDPPKAGIERSLAELADLGVGLRILTGDSRRVAVHVARRIGLHDPVVLTGPELRHLGEDALRARVGEVGVFAEVEPNQKERILRALQQAGHVVGYLGDGINDAPALHCADVSISVEGAVDVAKQAAEIVLLEKDLGVVAAGVREGRRTFVNTLKYVYITTSANFGNMLSMALAALFLPFLPLLPAQILLNNLLSDVPALTIAADRVDPESLLRPRRWNVRRIRDFMLLFGGVSSLFDFLAFAGLLWLLRVDAAGFRSAWFLVSVLTELGILLVMRTSRPSFRSRPARSMVLATLAVSAAALVLTVLPGAGRPFDLVQLTAPTLGLAGAIVVGYLAASELAKRLFFRAHEYGS